MSTPTRPPAGEEGSEARFSRAGAFVVLLLIGTCGEDDDDASPESAALQAPTSRSQDADASAERGDAAAAEARQARREARMRRLARERRARARARDRRERARRQELRELAAAPAVSTCDDNYTGGCLKPDSPDYDCAGGSGDGPDYTGLVRVVGSDVHDLDRDGDGIACDA